MANGGNGDAGGVKGSGRGIPEGVATALKSRFGNSRFGSLSDNGTSIYCKGGKIHVAVYTDFLVDTMRRGESDILEAINNDTGGKYRKVVYSINPNLGADYRARLGREKPKRIGPTNEDRPEERRAESFRVCSPHSHIDHPASDEASAILYAGNVAAHNAIRGVYDLSLAGLKQSSPLVLRGPNGLGKSHLVEILLRDAKKAGIPAVGCRVDNFIKYLRPDSRPASGNLFNPGWYDAAAKHAKLLVLDQFHTLYKWGKNKDTKETGYYLAKGTAQRLFELLESFDGNVVIPYTDIPLEFEDFTDMLTDDSIDIFNSIGHRDLGVRLEKYNSAKVKYPSVEDQKMIFGKLIDTHGAFVGVDSPELLVPSFLAANHRRKKPITLRDMANNVENVACASGWQETGISPGLIIDTVGTGWAKRGYEKNGLDFVRDAGNHAVERIPKNNGSSNTPAGIELSLDSGYCGPHLLPAAEEAAEKLKARWGMAAVNGWINGKADPLLGSVNIDDGPFPLFESGLDSPNA